MLCVVYNCLSELRNTPSLLAGFSGARPQLSPATCGWLKPRWFLFKLFSKDATLHHIWLFLAKRNTPSLLAGFSGARPQLSPATCGWLKPRWFLPKLFSKDATLHHIWLFLQSATPHHFWLVLVARDPSCPLLPALAQASLVPI